MPVESKSVEMVSEGSESESKPVDAFPSSVEVTIAEAEFESESESVVAVESVPVTEVTVGTIEIEVSAVLVDTGENETFSADTPSEAVLEEIASVLVDELLDVSVEFLSEVVVVTTGERFVVLVLDVSADEVVEVVRLLTSALAAAEEVENASPLDPDAGVGAFDEAASVAVKREYNHIRISSSLASESSGSSI